MSNEYFVDVVSNASMDIYPENTISKFINRLPTPLNLDGKWTVAVQEVFYPLQHKPLKRSITMNLYFRGSRSRVSRFDYNENDSIENIIENLNDVIQKVYNQDAIEFYGKIQDPELYYAPKYEIREFKVTGKDGKEQIKKKIVLHGGTFKEQSKPIHPIIGDHSFIRMLGFDLQEYRRDLDELKRGDVKEVIASHQPDTGPKSHLMFIYSDIIREHFTGDVSSRVLRVVPLHREFTDKLGHMNFHSPYYYPVRSNKIEDISIMMLDENGNPIRFKTGRVYLSLHFKKTV